MTKSYNLKQAPQRKISKDDVNNAISKGDVETVQIFLTQEGVNINQSIVDGFGLTLLGEAVLNNQLPIVQVLLAAKADFTGRVLGCGLLERAVGHEQFDIAQALIEAKADINARGNYHYHTSLLFSNMCYFFFHSLSAIEEEKLVKRTKFLLKHKADLYPASSANECPLALAMEIGLGPDIFEALIHAKADVNGNDMYGRNALRMAYEKKRYDLARLLVDAGSDCTKVFTPEEMSNLFLQLGERYRQEAASNEASEKTMLLPGNVSSHVIAPLPPELYPSYVFTPASARSYVEHHNPILSAYWKKLEVTKTPMLEAIPGIGTSSDVARPSFPRVGTSFDVAHVARPSFPGIGTSFDVAHVAHVAQPSFPGIGTSSDVAQPSSLEPVKPRVR